jgi:hypothetical protein
LRVQMVLGANAGDWEEGHRGASGADVLAHSVLQMLGCGTTVTPQSRFTKRGARLSEPDAPSIVCLAIQVWQIKAQ